MSRQLPPVLLLLVVLLTAAGGTNPAWAQGLTAPEESGSWDLSFERGNRRCRVTLRPDAVPAGYAVSMPAGCRHAFPNLGATAGWMPAGVDHIVFRSPGGETLIDFGPSGGPALSAVVGEAGNIYMLAPVDQTVQAALAEQGSQPAEAPPAGREAAAGPAAGDGVLVDSTAPATALAPAAATMLPPATAAEVVGHYAVLRQDRDTGCMVTLDAGINAKAESKAKLAPACRDQGIVIFDPVGWQLSKGQLILTAKKGHKAALTRRQDKTWATTPPKGAALVLKRL